MRRKDMKAVGSFKCAIKAEVDEILEEIHAEQSWINLDNNEESLEDTQSNQATSNTDSEDNINRSDDDLTEEERLESSCSKMIDPKDKLYLFFKQINEEQDVAVEANTLQV